MKRLIIISVILLLVLSPSVFALSGLNAVSSSGTWATSTINDFSVGNGLHNGLLSFSNTSIVHLRGINYNLSFTDFDVSRTNWYDMYDQKSVWYVVFINSTTSSFNMTLFNYLYDETDTWGLIKGKIMNTGMNINTTDLFYCPNFVSQEFGIYTFLPEGNYLSGNMWNDSNTVYFNSIWTRSDSALPNTLSNVSVTVPSGFLDNADVYLYIKHEGNGHFEGLSNIVIYDNVAYVPVLPTTQGIYVMGFFETFVSGISSVLKSVLPASVANLIIQMGSWATTIGTALIVVFVTFTGLLPFALILITLYVLDLCGTSIMKGTFTPIGDFTLTIYNTVSGFVSTLVGIGSAIYNFIKFW